MNRYKLVITFLALSLTLGVGISFVFSVWAGQIVEELIESEREWAEIQREWEKESKRRAQAILELEPLAENGDSEAQFTLGKEYHDEENALRLEHDTTYYKNYPKQPPMRLLVLANKNREHAETWLTRSAEQGNLEAQKYLWKDFKGRDNKKNIHWAQIVAERGDPESQNYLGEQYQKGEVILQDYVKALHWLHRAAEQGYTGAMFNLGDLYSEVKGVKEDLVQAHKWFNLGGYAKKRDRLAGRMTNKQIAEAQRLAREWKVKGK